MKKEVEIEKLLRFLAENYSKQSLVCYSTESMISISDTKAFYKEFRKDNPDVSILQIDFKKKKLELFTCMESHHNGDSYAQQSFEIPWGRLEELYQLVKDTATGVMIAVNKEEEKQKQEQVERAKAEEALRKLLRKK